MIRRRQTVAGLLVVAALPGLPLARAQTPGPLRRIARLLWTNPELDARYFPAYLEDLAQLGWIEGRDVAHTTFYAHGDDARISAQAAEAVDLKPDLIVVFNSALGALALQRATTAIPIVFVGTVDPEGLGLVSSLAQPGGNITGVAGTFDYEIIGKRLQLLREWLPRLSRLAVMYSPLEAANMAFLAETRRYATQLGLRLQELSLRDQADIDRAFAEMERVRPDVVYLFGNAVTLTHREAIVGRLTRMRIPATSAYLFIVEAGCFFAYMPLFRDFSKEAARFIDRILRGAKPSELPVTRVSRYELVINLKVARALSLTIPKSQLLRADRVIE